MSCEKYQEQFPAYIKKELDGENRIRIKSHLQECSECRELYFTEVKLNYIIDREEILESVPETSMDFNHEVWERINRSSDKKNKKSTKLIWYAAAATLLIGITIGRFVIPDNSGQRNLIQNGNESLSQLLASENWNRLEIVLSDREEFDKYSTDTIPIHILLEKLSALQKMGIQSLPIAYPIDSSISEEKKNVSSDLQISISVNDFIRLLEQAKKQRSQITLKDVTYLLKKI